MGSDYDIGGDGEMRRVSIHTPTWGVTDEQELEPFEEYVSIHTPTWGVT